MLDGLQVKNQRYFEENAVAIYIVKYKCLSLLAHAYEEISMIDFISSLLIDFGLAINKICLSKKPKTRIHALM